MNPERWQQIDKLLEQALEQEPRRRKLFLDGVCGSDNELRREVETLLAAHDHGGSLLSSPALAVARNPSVESARSLIGQSLSHYQILSRLGEGGMGIVYKARDQNLDRFVAIKVLPPELVADPERKRRFVQEAKAASALNHPNIITTHGILRDNGRDLIVMEYVDGKTLDKLIPRKGMPLKEALKIAIPMADALAKAHAVGIIHRDLKPGNIMISEGGLVKVLDFGLAKLVQQKGSDQAEADTQTRSGSVFETETGIILGTVSYMSPEQAAGKPVDARSDIFSFGSVLYEMVTGQRTFQGDSKMSTLAAVLNQDPKPARQISSAIPQDLDNIIGRCLRKDPERRFQHMSDVKVFLQEVLEKLGSAYPAETSGSGLAKAEVDEASRATFRKRPLVFVAIGCVLTAGLVTGWYRWRRAEPLVEPTQRQLTTNSPETPVTTAAISPDGKYLAFADENGTYLKVIETSERHTLALPASLKVSHLTWFPDSTRLAACGTSGDEKLPGLWSVSILGGDPRRLREATLNAAVSPDGARIALVSGTGNEIWLMGPNGENAEKIATGAKEDHFLRLIWSPHGRRLGYLRQRTAKQNLEIETCDLKGTSATVLFVGSWLSDICLSSDGRVLYSIAEQLNRVQSSLWEIPANPETGQALGKPVRVLTWPGFEVRGLSVSQGTGQLVLLKGTSQAEIYVGELEEAGKRMKVPERLTFDDRYDAPNAWTPDSKAVIFSSDRNGNLDIFKQALGNRSAEPIMATLEEEVDPTVSPDGKWILYFDRPTGLRLNSTNPMSLKRAPISGGPAQEVLNEVGFARIGCALVPSGRCVVDLRTENQLRFYSFDPLQGKGKELANIELDSSVRTYSWELSPNGSQLAVTTANKPDRIHVLSLTDKTSKDVEIVAPGWSVFEGGWSADGKGWLVTGLSAGSEALLHVDGHGRNASLLYTQPISAGGLWAIPSPDGRYLAFPKTISTSNAWMLENF